MPEEEKKGYEKKVNNESYFTPKSPEKSSLEIDPKPKSEIELYQENEQKALNDDLAALKI